MLHIELFVIYQQCLIGYYSGMSGQLWTNIAWLDNVLKWIVNCELTFLWLDNVLKWIVGCELTFLWLDNFLEWIVSCELTFLWLDNFLKWIVSCELTLLGCIMFNIESFVMYWHWDNVACWIGFHILTLRGRLSYHIPCPKVPYNYIY